MRRYREDNTLSVSRRVRYVRYVKSEDFFTSGGAILEISGLALYAHADRRILRSCHCLRYALRIQSAAASMALAARGVARVSITRASIASAANARGFLWPAKSRQILKTSDSETGRSRRGEKASMGKSIRGLRSARARVSFRRNKISRVSQTRKQRGARPCCSSCLRVIYSARRASLKFPW